MGIINIALDYINQDITQNKIEKTAGKRKTRQALQSRYEKLREKYKIEKKKVEEIVAEAEVLKKDYERQTSELKKLYDKHNNVMQAIHRDMKTIRTKLERIDDEGIDKFEEPEEEVPEEDPEVFEP